MTKHLPAAHTSEALYRLVTAIGTFGDEIHASAAECGRVYLGALKGAIGALRERWQSTHDEHLGIRRARAEGSPLFAAGQYESALLRVHNLAGTWAEVLEDYCNLFVDQRQGGGRATHLPPEILAGLCGELLSAEIRLELERFHLSHSAISRPGDGGR